MVIGQRVLCENKEEHQHGVFLRIGQFLPHFGFFTCMWELSPVLPNMCSLVSHYLILKLLSADMSHSCSVTDEKFNYINDCSPRCRSHCQYLCSHFGQFRAAHRPFSSLAKHARAPSVLCTIASTVHHCCCGALGTSQFTITGSESLDHEIIKKYVTGIAFAICRDQVFLLFKVRREFFVANKQEV